MKVVIMCGGKGTRLGAITGDLAPKPMTLIGEEPILVHIMRGYSKQGFSDFVLCVGHLSWIIKSFFLHYRSRTCDVTITTRKGGGVIVHEHGELDDWTVTIVETGNETATAGRLRRAGKFLDAEETFMLTYGDGLADVDLTALCAFHAAHGRAVTMTGVIPPGRFGEMKLEGDRVSDWAEKPTSSDRYINGGYFVLEPSFFDRFVRDKGDDVMLEREPLAEAADAGELMVYKHHGFWQCMDTPRDWQILNELWAAGTAPWAGR